MLFLVVVTSTQHYWVISAERRRSRAINPIAELLRGAQRGLIKRWSRNIALERSSSAFMLIDALPKAIGIRR
jgi:hypothetical protein